jgi:hypothetical protein
VQGDLAKLKQLNVGEEMIERMGGQIAAWKAEGSIVDSQILDTSDMEMVEMKMFGENPIIILRVRTAPRVSAVSAAVVTLRSHVTSTRAAPQAVKGYGEVRRPH